MQQHCVVGKVFSISLNHEHTDERNLNIVRAARVLGLNNTYVGHFTRQYCDKIREHDLNYELMGTIATLAYPGNDPIYDCLANNIANQRKRGTVSDPEGLKAFLDLHPTLMHKVEAIEGTKATKKAGPIPRRMHIRNANKI
ncbi:hypothetical protein K458DRAFT_416387 [Lentithecium fluviatile CBS 122367]|uniref:Uncharacterized protein n=1 Tax=Lentithecium fluviatile CBS 122367 TaxID=1168545 RepID=A0A6G1J7C3_9PLEO|nr:hypothetical protein K458DRAFT_416387 [Lentithecium fluviatile CBS 122367]